MSQIKVCPSILAGDFANLQREIEMINSSTTDFVHIDIMDGIFVPNISFGFPVTKAIQKHAEKPLDFHLMIQNPDLYLEQCIDSGAEIISVHIEACNHLHRTISRIKELGAKAGVALNPHTPVNTLEDILEDIDVALIMSVNPGFGGQQFIERTYEKVRQLRSMAEQRNPSLDIEIDGGVSASNATALKEAGATMLVAGSFVFRSSDPVQTIKDLSLC
ncbi:MAG: ribulose-phosphate 3-epimerase [Cytophagales bacterium]|nr:ribulose-phosphate 3-epimerase [Cytophagales bacterium]